LSTLRVLYEVCRGQFHYCFTLSFYKRRSQKCNKTMMTWLVFLHFWDLGSISSTFYVQCSADPKSIKKTVKLSIFFTLLGSTSVKDAKTLVKLIPARVKAALKTLVKLTPDVITALNCHPIAWLWAKQSHFSSRHEEGGGSTKRLHKKGKI